MNNIKPITPETVVAHKASILPEWVISTWNDAIAKNWDGARAYLSQEEILAALTDASRCLDTELTRDDIFRCRYLDVEPIYEAAGWTVRYNDQSANHSFTFVKATPPTPHPTGLRPR